MKEPTSRTSRGRRSYGKPRPSQPKTATPTDVPTTSTPPISSIGPDVALPPLSEPVPTDTPRFADLGKENLLHPTLLKTIAEDLKFDHMTPVQAATLHDLLEKRIDVLAQAKTGTGKTIAFLLPAIQTMMNKNRGRNSGISLLVISPTRELAMQIAKEATLLLQHLPQFKVAFAIGGTNKDREERSILSRDGCDILIATPGRLYDHLSNQDIRNSFRNLDTLVLDEADRLLDMGFMAALKDIIACLPDKNTTQRQGMLFSATIAPHVEKFAYLVLNKDYKFISTIPKGEVNTHERVPQLLVTVPDFHNVCPALVSAVRSEIKIVGKASFKAIIFAPTSTLADWYAHILESLKDMPQIMVLHSKKTQSKRTQVTDAFRVSTSSILVATDVVARGMDFPNVSNVLQVGLPADKETYIHRLGRTARAGREGRAYLIVTEAESFFPTFTMKEITFIPTEPDFTSTLQDVEKAAATFEFKDRVYQAWLGYYKNYVRQLRWSLEELVHNGNQFAFKALLTGEVPPIRKDTVSKMGLKGIKGLNVSSISERPSRGRGGGGRGGRGPVGDPVGGSGRQGGGGGRDGGAGGGPRRGAGGNRGGARGRGGRRGGGQGVGE